MEVDEAETAALVFRVRYLDNAKRARVYTKLENSAAACIYLCVCESVILYMVRARNCTLDGNPVEID